MGAPKYGSLFSCWCMRWMSPAEERCSCSVSHDLATHAHDCCTGQPGALTCTRQRGDTRQRFQRAPDHPSSGCTASLQHVFCALGPPPGPSPCSVAAGSRAPSTKRNVTRVQWLLPLSGYRRWSVCIARTCCVHSSWYMPQKSLPQSAGQPPLLCHSHRVVTTLQQQLTNVTAA